MKWFKKSNEKQIETLKKETYDLNFLSKRLMNNDENTTPKDVMDQLDKVNKLRKYLQRVLDNEQNKEMAHFLEMQLTLLDAEIGTIALRLNHFLQKKD